MKIKNISLIFIVIILLMGIFNVTAFAECENAKTEAEDYYKLYNVTLNIAVAHPKYPKTDTEITQANQYKASYPYAITYVQKNGDICNLYVNEIPDNFGIWNTDIVVNDGRVVVTGVDGDDQSAWNLIYEKYRFFIVGISGLGAMTCVLAFIVFFMKMGATSGNPSERSKCLTMLLFTGAGAAGLGAVALIFGFFWNLL